MSDHLPIGESPRNCLPGANRRQFRRSAIILGGRFLTPSSSHDCVVLNVSAGGARLRSGFIPDIGDRGRLVIDRLGSFDAEIVWTSDEHPGAGLRFEATPADVTRAVLAV